MFGQINEWFFRHLTGIQGDPDGPGFQKIIIKPAVVGNLTHAEGSYVSVRGKIVSAWRRDGTRLTLNVTIPPNTTATVYVPTNDPATVTESGHPAAHSPGVTPLPSVTGAPAYHVGSGDYVFASTLPSP